MTGRRPPRYGGAPSAEVLDEDCSCRWAARAYGQWRRAEQNPGCLIHGTS